ncbi:MAG: fatty acid desaturase [Rhizobiaceae bacterium]|nr:fatty acid desaturase [Rhizobiaceae bacterium]
MATFHFDESSPSEERKARSRFAVEWPTLLLALFIHAGWLFLTWFWQSIPLLLLFLLGGWLVAWHGSLQHEVLHGHPTRFRRVNDAIGSLPIGLWLPYPIYKRAHLKHHNDEWLTDPIEDPESYYLTGPNWQRLGASGRLVTHVNNTLPGRLVIGPFIALAAFWGHEAMAIARGDFRHVPLWAAHLAGVAVVLTWVLAVAQMPLWIYLLCFVYAGLSFSRLRSFAEHNYADTKEERTAIVENTPAFGLLFLYNNLHVVHHSKPAIPWYRIPGLYRANRDAYIRLNGGLVYNGYRDVAKRYFFRTHHRPVHPWHPETADGREPSTTVRADQATFG